jgi:phosphatidylglycerol phospholipase C
LTDKAKYLEPCAKHLPAFALSNISFSTLYSRLFLSPKTPNVTFNILYTALMMPHSGPGFIKDAHAQARAVFTWTVNDESAMKWSMKHQVDGIITDDVEKLVRVKEAWEKGDRKVSISLRSYIFVGWVWALSMIIGAFLRYRMGNRLFKKNGNQR